MCHARLERQNTKQKKKKDNPSVRSISEVHSIKALSLLVACRLGSSSFAMSHVWTIASLRQPSCVIPLLVPVHIRKPNSLVGIPVPPRRLQSTLHCPLQLTTHPTTNVWPYPPAKHYIFWDISFLAELGYS